MRGGGRLLAGGALSLRMAEALPLARLLLGKVVFAQAVNCMSIFQRALRTLTMCINLGVFFPRGICVVSTSWWSVPK